MSDYLLGIDVGTTNCKALIFDTAGVQRAAASAPTPVNYPRPGWAEHDPEALWQAVVTVVRQALEPGRPGAGARCGGGRAWPRPGCLLDVAGRPVTPLIAWYDSRSDPQYRRWREQFGDERFLPIAGNRPNPIFGAFKLQWLRDNEPDAYAAAARWLHVADYIAFRLCGVQATDYSLATRTMLFDLPNLCWSDALIAAAGLRADLLPAAVPAGTRLGGVTAGRRCCDRPAGGDRSRLRWARPHLRRVCGRSVSGRRRPGTRWARPRRRFCRWIRCGLVLPVGCAARSARMWRAANIASSKGIHSSGAAIAWAARLLDLGDAGAASYDRMQSAAAQAPPGSCGVFFLPRLAPIDRGAFIGLTASAGPAEMARAVYEGLAYEWRAYLEADRTGQRKPCATQSR